MDKKQRNKIDSLSKYLILKMLSKNKIRKAISLPYVKNFKKNAGTPTATIDPNISL